MGYFKNQLIADQVELGDRVPAPKPASSHVAYQHGILSRRFVRNLEREHRDYHRATVTIAGVLALGAGILIGFAAGVFL